jgi:hypothetical protein
LDRGAAVSKTIRRCHFELTNHYLALLNLSMKIKLPSPPAPLPKLGRAGRAPESNSGETLAALEGSKTPIKPEF